MLTASSAIVTLYEYSAVQIKLQCECIAKLVGENYYTYNLCTKKIYSPQSCLFKRTILFIYKYLHSIEQHCVDLFLHGIHCILKIELFYYFQQFSIIPIRKISLALGT